MNIGSKKIESVKDLKRRLSLLEKVTDTVSWYIELETLSFVYVSENFYNFHGLEQTAEVNYVKLLNEAVHPADRTMVEQNRLKFFQSKEIVLINQFRFIHQTTGEIIRLLTRTEKTFDEEGNLVGLIGTTSKIEPRSSQSIVKEFKDYSQKNLPAFLPLLEIL